MLDYSGFRERLLKPGVSSRYAPALRCSASPAASSRGCRALIVAAAVGIRVESEVAQVRLDAIVQQADLVHVGNDLLMHVAAEDLAEPSLPPALGHLGAVARDAIDLGLVEADSFVGDARELAAHHQAQRLLGEVLDL